jgi:hypothetical protein
VTAQRDDVKPALIAPRERILLCAESTDGKSYGWLMQAQRDYEVAKRDGTKSPTYYAVDPENAASDLLGEGRQFHHLWYENEGGNVQAFTDIGSWQDLVNAYRTAASASKQGDWLIIDSITESYELAQHKVAGAKGFDLDDRSFDRALDEAGYGKFEGKEWQAVKMVMQHVTRHALVQLRANLLLTTHLKELVDFHTKKERQAMFGFLGMVPTSPAWLDKQVTTIAVLRRERKVGTSPKRYVYVVKDRGHEELSEKSDEIGHEWYQGLLALRKERVAPISLLGD